MVSILAITVSAWPPHNFDTDAMDKYLDDAIQEMDQSPGDAAENLQYFQESDIEMLDQPQDDATQDVQQPPDAATQNAQQPPDAATQNVQQPPDAATQNVQQLLESDIQILQYFQDSDIQVLDRLLDAATQSLQQPPDAATQSLQQSPDAATQNVQQSPDAATQSVPQSPDATTQSAHQYQGPGVQEIGKLQGASPENIQALLNLLAQNSQQSQDAATQSTQQPQGAATQSLQKFLDATTQSVQQPPDSSSNSLQRFLDASVQGDQVFDKSKIRVEMHRLTRAFKIQEDDFPQMENYINAERKNIVGVNDMIKAVDSKLQDTSLSSDTILQLRKKSRELRMVADELIALYKDKYRTYMDAKERRRNANAALQLLKENQELIAEHNSKNVIQVGLSHGSSYNLDMLEIQYDKVLKDIDALFAEQKKIGGVNFLYSDDAFKAKREEFDNQVLTLQSYSGFARRILWHYKYNWSIDAWVSEFLSPYMQNAKII
ncbi:hypothetical protein BASA50_001288 [Batrachochytrium salamandrivorans]|uniref:Uncharacterized protein n=1 Tax=Batrachochytrium salamandrivorans TaxID=1357716 RepID=A0ABQ8EVP5_9FUNG|nr:hypothetical protein BASA50_001288 [Batrachochytrium salamandrivorans]